MFSPGKASRRSHMTHGYNEIIPLESSFETDLDGLCTCVRNAGSPVLPQFIIFSSMSYSHGSLLLRVWQLAVDDSFSTSLFLSVRIAFSEASHCVKISSHVHTTQILRGIEVRIIV